MATLRIEMQVSKVLRVIDSSGATTEEQVRLTAAPDQRATVPFASVELHLTTPADFGALPSGATFAMEFTAVG